MLLVKRAKRLVETKSEKSERLDKNKRYKKKVRKRGLPQKDYLKTFDTIKHGRLYE